MLSGPLRLHSFVELSRGLFAASDIADTERRILRALGYVVNPPTGRRFVGELLRVLALAHDDGRGGAPTVGRGVMACLTPLTPTGHPFVRL